MEHTKEPWNRIGRTINVGPKIKIGVAYSSDDFEDDHVKKEHSVTGEEAIANAAYIVRCVNSHEALVEALKALDEATCFLIIQLSRLICFSSTAGRDQPEESYWDDLNAARVKAQAALAAAEEE